MFGTYKNEDDYEIAFVQTIMIILKDNQSENDFKKIISPDDD